MQNLIARGHPSGTRDHICCLDVIITVFSETADQPQRTLGVCTSMSTIGHKPPAVTGRSERTDRIPMITPILVITPILGLIGVVVGAVLQFVFTRHLDTKKQQRELRAQAYADYLRCVSELANLGHQQQSAEARQLRAEAADAKCRISLYGAPAVISCFSKFERLGATMNTVEQRHAFTDMVVAMRNDAFGKSPVIHAELEAVLLGFHRSK